MHIVQIAPPWFPVPPRAYGGIERVVHDLTEGLVTAGHEVTLLAPAGSQTKGQLIPIVPEGFGLDRSAEDKMQLLAETSREAYAIAATLGADIIHDHTDFPADADFPIPIVRTVHGPATDPYSALYQDMSLRGDHFVAISARQRQLFQAGAARLFGPSGHIAFAGVIHNPTDVAATPFYPASAKANEPYVAFLGRSHWEKGPDAALRVAMAAGVKLKMALRVTVEERPYFDAVIQPLLDAAGDRVEFIGEVGGPAKDELIGRASALLFTSPWEEPFGLVLTEALARGTPVVALARGAATEVVRDGVTGILCRDEAEMIQALTRAMALDPAACRAHARACFDRPAIARRYVRIFETLAQDAQVSGRVRSIRATSREVAPIAVAD